MLGTQLGQKDTASYSTCNGRGGTVKGQDYRTGHKVWQVRLSQDYGIIKAGRLASESQEDRTDLEARRIEGTKEAAETKEAVA